MFRQPTVYPNTWWGSVFEPSNFSWAPIFLRWGWRYLGWTLGFIWRFFIWIHTFCVLKSQKLPHTHTQFTQKKNHPWRSVGSTFTCEVFKNTQSTVKSSWLDGKQTKTLHITSICLIHHHWETNKQTNKQSNKQAKKNKQTNKQKTNKQTNNKKNKQTNKQTKTNKQTNKKTHKKKQTNKQTNIETIPVLMFYFEATSTRLNLTQGLRNHQQHSVSITSFKVHFSGLKTAKFPRSEWNKVLNMLKRTTWITKHFRYLKWRYWTL